MQLQPQKSDHILIDAKTLLVEEINEAVEEIKLILSGKKQVRDAEDFLNDLV